MQANNRHYKAVFVALVTAQITVGCFECLNFALYGVFLVWVGCLYQKALKRLRTQNEGI